MIGALKRNLSSTSILQICIFQLNSCTIQTQFNFFPSPLQADPAASGRVFMSQEGIVCTIAKMKNYVYLQ